jgi:3-phosphoshikimate 1-carboxyvinyltransferase
VTPTNDIVIRPAKNVTGAVRLPGDKSISHRYAMLGALAAGTTRLRNFSTGADCASTLGTLASVGVDIRRMQDGLIEIEGSPWKVPSSPLDCGNSGSTMRMLSGLLAGQPFTAELTGDESLSRRPMARVIEPLSKMGASIDAAPGGRPPLRITGHELRGIEYSMPIASAQVKTAILFATLFARGTTMVEEPVRTRDHGELALQAFGAELARDGNRVNMAGGQKLRAIDAAIPGDISSAAFFLCAAALFPGSNLLLDSVLMNPTRAALLDVLLGMGCRVSVVNVEEHHGELVGTVAMEGALLKGTTISGALSAALIDELPVLAAIGPYTSGGIEIRDARELRVKESDRIAAVAANLRAMGATVEEREDGLRVPGNQQLYGAEIDSAGDHRIAMAFAVAALRATGDTLIRGAAAAQISYPEFFNQLEALVER